MGGAGRGLMPPTQEGLVFGQPAQLHDSPQTVLNRIHAVSDLSRDSSAARHPIERCARNARPREEGAGEAAPPGSPISASNPTGSPGASGCTRGTSARIRLDPRKAMRQEADTATGPPNRAEWVDTSGYGHPERGAADAGTDHDLGGLVLVPFPGDAAAVRLGAGMVTICERYCT